jgi:diguanylate cyclase (GGDEF)-like protein
MNNLLKDRAFVRLVLILTLFVAVYSFFLSKTVPFRISRLKTQDIFTALAYRFRPLPDNINKIIVVSVDDESYRVLNKKYPWERKMYAEFLDKIRGYNPKVVTLDFVFSGESPYPGDDLELARSFKQSGNVIIAAYVDSKGLFTLPLKIINDSVFAFGLINKTRNTDFILRSFRGFVTLKGRVKPFEYSLEIKTLAKYLDASLDNIYYQDGNIVLNSPGQKKFLVSATKKGIIDINYRVKFKNLFSVPFWKIIKNEVRPEAFKDKIILVGPTAELFHDIFSTPLGTMSGITTVANAMLMFLNRDFVGYIPEYAEFMLILGLGLLTAVWSFTFSPLPSLIYTLFGLLLLWVGSYVLFLKNFRLDHFGATLIMVFTYLIVTIYKYIRLWIENANLRTLAITDGLTGLFIHRYLILRLQSEFDRALRYELNFAFLIMDIDHFKQINDTYGHEQGNVVLKNIARILQDQTRKTDMIARYGGEEFCAVLTHTTIEGASVFAERVRKSIEEFEFPLKDGKPLKVTISIGVVAFPDLKAQKVEELIESADKALYQAKESGRNRVCVFN